MKDVLLSTTDTPLQIGVDTSLNTLKTNQYLTLPETPTLILDFESSRESKWKGYANSPHLQWRHS